MMTEVGDGARAPPVKLAGLMASTHPRCVAGEARSPCRADCCTSAGHTECRRARVRPAVRRGAGQGRGDGGLEGGPRRSAAIPGPRQVAAQVQRGQRPGLLGVPRRAVRGIRLLPDGVGDRPHHHQRPLAAGLPRRPHRRCIRAQPRQFCAVAGGPGHRKSAGWPRLEPGKLDRQPRRTGAGARVLHSRVQYPRPTTRT